MFYVPHSIVLQTAVKKGKKKSVKDGVKCLPFARHTLFPTPVFALFFLPYFIFSIWDFFIPPLIHCLYPKEESVVSYGEFIRPLLNFPSWPPRLLLSPLHCALGFC